MYKVLSCHNCSNHLKTMVFEGMHDLLSFYQETVFAHAIFGKLLELILENKALPKMKTIKKGIPAERKWPPVVALNEFPNELISSIRGKFQPLPATAH